MRCGDSAHGGPGRANWAKNFLKIFKKRGGKPKNWGTRGGAGAAYIGCARRFLSLGARPLAALLEVRFVQASQVRTPVARD